MFSNYKIILCMYLEKVITSWIWSAQSFCFYFCFFCWENLPIISIEVTALYEGAITSKFLHHLDPFPIVCDVPTSPLLSLAEDSSRSSTSLWLKTGNSGIWSSGHKQQCPLVVPQLKKHLPVLSLCFQQIVWGIWVCRGIAPRFCMDPIRSSM